MDHTFSSTGAIRQHHHHHQQSVRNSLSPSPALNNYYRISPSPTNTNILTAAATPSGISPYSNNKSSPTPTGYQNASPQTVVNPANISNLYRVQTLTVQQQLQQYLQQQQQLQQHIHPGNPSSFGQPTVSPPEVSYNQGRVSSGQYPVRQQNTSSGIIPHHHQQQKQQQNRVPIQISSNPPVQNLVSTFSTQANLTSRPQANSTYSSGPLTDNNFRNQQQQTQSLHQTHSHSQPSHHQQFQQSHPQQYQPQPKPQTQTPQQPPPPQPQPIQHNNSQQTMNKTRFINNQPQTQASINSNGVPCSSNPNPSAIIHQQSTQQQQLNQNQTIQQHSSMNNANSNMNSNNPVPVPTAPNSGTSSPSSQTQPQYRIFKRGDSIPGISSPIQITTQVATNANENKGSSQIANENWDNNASEGNPPPAGLDSNLDNQNGNDKENSSNATSSKKSLNDVKGANRTPLSQIGEIARFHSVQVEYRLVKETGPPHAPTFTVLLRIGNEDFTGQGPSIKKAQHAAAVEALEKTSLAKPPPKSKPKRSFNQAGGGGVKRPNWAIIQLTNLAQELQLSLQFVQQPVAIVDPFRRGEPPSIVSVHVGERIFTGEGSNFNAAKNMAIMIALKAMIKVKQEMDLAKLVQAGVDAEQNMMDADNKSPISIVHEMGMKRSLPVGFEIIQEAGPPHMKVFTVKCKVGEDLETIGEGPTKQAAKKASSELMIAKLKEIPIQLPASSQGINIKAMQRGLLRQKLAKKKTSTPVVKDLGQQEVSPISRLIQICHIKKLKEPEFVLVSTGTETNVENFLKQITERDRRMLRKKKPVFTIEVTIGSHTCQGTGPNKKAAKKAAAEAAILAMGYEPTEGLKEGGDINSELEIPVENGKTSNNTTSTTGGKRAAGNKVNLNGKMTGISGQSEVKTASTSGSSSSPTVKLAGARQIAPGVIVLKKENPGAGGTTSSTAAQEMKKVNNLISGVGGQQSSREGIEKLSYLSKLLDISVSYSDFPKKNEYLSVVSLTTNPPHVAHGCGTTLEEAQNAAALKILEELSTMDLDLVTAAAEKTSE